MISNKKILIAKICVLFGWVPVFIHAFSGGPPPGRTGAPGERTCNDAGCHNSFPLVPDSSAIQISFPQGPAYQPGVTQRLTLTVTDPQASVYGFQLSARDAQNAQAGTLAAVDADTQVTASSEIQYLQHARPRPEGTFNFDWTPPAAAAGNVTIYVAANAANGNGTPGGDRIHVRSFTLAPGSSEATPIISERGVVDAAAFQPGIVAGSWVSIFGQNLAPGTRTWRNDEIRNGILPTELDGVRVNINGKPAAVFFISPTQLNVQAPDDGAEGPVQVEVIRNGASRGASTAQLQKFVPGFFMFDPEGRKYLAAVHPDGTFAGKANLFQGAVATRPAKPGDILLLFGTGFGSTDPPVPAGQVFTGAAALTNAVTLRFGDAAAEVLFAGLSGAGLYQFNVRVPEGAPDGDVPVVVEIGGLRSQENAFITVQR